MPHVCLQEDEIVSLLIVASIEDFMAGTVEELQLPRGRKTSESQLGWEVNWSVTLYRESPGLTRGCSAGAAGAPLVAWRKKIQFDNLTQFRWCMRASQGRQDRRGRRLRFAVGSVTSATKRLCNLAYVYCHFLPTDAPALEMHSLLQA